MLLRRDQLRYLGLIGVTAIIAAYLSHMLDVTSSDEDVRDASTLRLYQSLEVLQAFREIYTSADAAVSFLASVSRKAGVTIPMQAAISSAESATTTAHLQPAPVSESMTSSNYASYSQTATSNPSKTVWQTGSQRTFPKTTQSGSYNSALHTTNGVNFANDTAPQTGTSPGTFSTPNDTHMGIARPASTPANQHDSYYSVTTDLEGPSDYTADAAFYSWAYGLDNANGSMEFEPLSFNYDFYADAFELSDNHIRST